MSSQPRARSWPVLFVTFPVLLITFYVAALHVAALSPARAEGSISVGDDTYEFGDFKKQQDGTLTADIYSSPDGQSGTLVRNPEDGTHLISLSGGKNILIAGSGCTDNPDVVKDFKEVSVRECRRDEDGKLFWHKVNYLEYTCTKPPYYTRRIPQSVVAEEPEAPCTEEDYQASGRAAAVYGGKWVGVKPPTETPPPGGKEGGGLVDTPPGVTKYPCLTDEAKADLRRAQQNLALEFVQLTEALQHLHPVNQRISAAEANYKAVKAKLDAVAKAGEDTKDANWDVWDAGNRLVAAKKALAGLLEVIKLHERFIKYYKAQVDYYSSLPPCPEVKEVEGRGGGGQPGEKPGSKPLRRWTPLFPESWKISTGTDGETWCTYGDGNGEETSIALTDENGVSVDELIETLDSELEQVATLLESMPPAPPETPRPTEDVTTPSEQPPVTETVPEKPTTPPETPTTTEKVPEQPTTPPETPPTAEKPPEKPTTPPETPPVTENVPEEPTSEIPDTIFVKAKEEVLEGHPPGNPIENQVVKLFPPEEPALPGTGETKEASDTGFDKDPVECMTGAAGDCEMQIPPEDRAEYDLPDTGEIPAHYRADYDLPKDSGGVAETTGKPGEPDVTKGTPDGAEVATEAFNIGERSFIRFVYEQVFGLDHNFEEQFKPLFGDAYEEDYCRDKQPGPPLGNHPPSYSALNRDLPQATIKFGQAVPGHGDAP